MAVLFNVLRTCSLLFCYLSIVFAYVNPSFKPWIEFLKVDEKYCINNNCKYLLTVRGADFLGHYSWKLTPSSAKKGNICDVIYPSYELKEIITSTIFSKLEVIISDHTAKVYFCLLHNNGMNDPFGGEWIHQGDLLYLDPNIETSLIEIKNFESKSNPDQAQTESLKTDDELIESNDLRDLSHDTDVNYLPNASKVAKQEIEDVEMIKDGEYDALNESDKGTSQIPHKNSVIIKNTNDIDNVEQTFKDRLKIMIDDLNDNKFDDLNRVITYLMRKKREASDKEAIVSELDINYSSFEFFNDDNKKNVINDDINNDNNDKVTNNDNNYNRNNVNDSNRKKREVFERNSTGDWSSLLISPYEIFKAKMDLENDVNMQKKHENHTDALIRMRKYRQADSANISDFRSVKAPRDDKLKIVGMRVEDSVKEPKINEMGVPSVLAGSKVTLRLFGEGLTPRTVIAFTQDKLDYGQPCKFMLKGEYMVKKYTVTENSALFEIKAPPASKDSKLYLCAKNLKPGNTDPSQDAEKHYHLGNESWKILSTHDALLPLWFAIVLILVCLTFSALFSGLNLGLMSLDKTELKIISNTGTEQERKYARAIMPVRDHGNYLLCSILLGNVAVNSTFTILLDELTSGLFAVIFSTLCIVLLGEITPQAICSRHGLMIGAKSIMVTKAVMALTAPLAFPVSKLLDYFLGEEIGSVYNRERLKELVKVTTDVNDLDKDEVNIISGALELRKKTVSDVMTKLEDSFMLPITSVLDFETMSEIIKSGYSRIPVYEGTRGNIVTVLFIKDLAFVDPDDNTPLRTLCQYYQNPCNFVFEDVTLDIMFRQFKDGHKGHMAFVHRINSEGEGDPFYETMGLVTLEDVIEEMIQSEILDETDVYLDNRTKKRRKNKNKLQDFLAFAERHEHQRINISPQLILATFQFLSTSVDAFRPDTVSEMVLRRLLRQDVIHYIKLKGNDKTDLSTYIYQQGKPVDYFVLILEGRVEVTVGRENLVFEAGPFSYFGVQALTQISTVAESPTPSAQGSLQNISLDTILRHTFVPDYSVRAITHLYYLSVKRSLYFAAKRASSMEKGALSKGSTNEQFDTEVDKLLQSVDEDISVSGEHKTPSRQVSPNPMPVSASPHTRSSFKSRVSPEPRNGNLYPGEKADEQEKLLK